jgi:gamma-glutamyltranspeptidase / glutathione hydrolase
MDNRAIREITAALAGHTLDPEAGLVAVATLAQRHATSPGLFAEIAAAITEIENRLGVATTQQAFINALTRNRQKRAEGLKGAIATSSPEAASAGARVLAEGGNAIDAACTAALALTVTDPANASIGGRCHIVIRWRRGGAVVVDAATQVPSRIDGAGRADDITCVPVPGMLAGIAMAAASGASRNWAELVDPAVALADSGFEVPSGLGAVWAVNRERLMHHPETARTFLKPDGTPYATGERFYQPALARLLRRVAADGPEVLYRDQIADDIAAQMAEEGGCVRADDLAGYTAREGEAVEGRYGPYTFTVPGVQAWGHSLVEMLQIADRFEFSGPTWSAQEAETLALIILVALDDRPERLGSLRPKSRGLPRDLLADSQFASDRARYVERLVQSRDVTRDAEVARLVAATAHATQGDTTHLSVIDAEGTAVSLTCSLGPHFGSAITAKRYGFLYAHSYRMISRPSPGARDVTEMCPAVFSLAERPVLAIGGAGSERIPCAVTFSVVNLWGRGRSALDAVAAPRFAWTDARLRAHCDLGAPVRAHLAQRGFPVQLIGRGYLSHVGVVHLVRADADGRCEAVADPAYDGVGLGR